MSKFQSKHSKLSQKEISELLERFNISLVQLPKIKKSDPALPEGCEVGEVIKIIRKNEEGDDEEYFRVVVD